VKRALAGRVAVAVMLVVTAWSVWAWGQHRPVPARATEKATEEGTGKGAAEDETPEPVNWVDFGKTDREGAPFPPYVAMLVNFGILAAGYYLLGRKPIAAALQNRRDAIAKEIEEAQRMRHEAEVRAKTYQAKLEKLEDEVRTAREALVRAGEAEGDRIVKEAQAKAERMQRDAEFVVEQEVKQIRQDLWRDAVATAVAAAEELLRRRVTPADHERLAEDYLGDLGAKPKPETGRTDTGMGETA